MNRPSKRQRHVKPLHDAIADRRARMRAQLPYYLVAPDGWGRAPADIDRLEQLLVAGVGIVQFRDKQLTQERVARARRMVSLCHNHNALCIINDDPVLAVEVEADGVHVGEQDVEVRHARTYVGPTRLVGATAKDVTRAQHAIRDGADYVGVGAIYDARASKADATTIGLAGLQEIATMPTRHDTVIVAIGGITMADVPACLAAGADGVAMIRGLWHLEKLNALTRVYPRTTGIR